MNQHAKAFIEDDGEPPLARRFRYVCQCSKAGEWRASEQAAKNDHTIHKHTADLGGGWAG